ncbi:MAG: trigger factor [Clostridia bacterium]|nr:trigger factor [Clostridia bacterium]
MALKSSTKVETNVYEVAVTLEGEAVAKAAQDAYLKAKKNITIPGFRKGKAPRQIIEKLYGENFFYEEGLENLLQGAVSDAIDEAKLDIVDNPRDLEVQTLGKDGAEFTFKVTVKPEVKIGEYKGLKAEKATVRVEASEVEAELNSLREKGAREISVEDRAAEKDDIADIDFEGFVDGVAFDGGKGEHFALTLGSGQFIPGFEDQVIGHNIGDEFDVNVTFPEEYTPELAGKAAVFKVKLHGLKVRELPELDDEFAKDVSEDADTLDDLKKSIKEEIRKRKQERADADFRTKIYDQLIDLIDAEIPEVMFEKRVEEDKNNFAQRVGMHPKLPELLITPPLPPTLRFPSLE